MNPLIISSELIQVDAVKLLKALPITILVKNASFEFVAANHKAGVLTGFKNPAKMIGLTDAQLNCSACEIHEQIWQQDRAVIAGSEQSFLDIGYSLTKRQAECMFYLLRVKSIKEIAYLLKRSPRTIEDHIALHEHNY